MNNRCFLIDSNALIHPYREYYPFDLAKSFWDQMEKHIEEGSIIILDMVKQELQKGNENDQLKEWIERININNSIDHKENDIIEQYRQVIQYVQECGYYKDTALRSWSDLLAADPWLIAAAKARSYPLVSFETRSQSQDKNQKSKRVRIPDGAKFFNVEVVSLFDMMRELKFQL